MTSAQVVRTRVDRRLGEIKRAYDPTNVFRNNHNILPGRDPR